MRMRWIALFRAASLCTIMQVSGVPSALAACGDNGGPGYRSQSGRCVGWEALARQCGNPPSTKCTPERVAEGSQDAAAKGDAIRLLMDRSHEAKKVQTNP